MSTAFVVSVLAVQAVGLLGLHWLPDIAEETKHRHRWLFLGCVVLSTVLLWLRALHS